jgi:hypothetical protein
MRPACDWYQVKLAQIRKFIDDRIITAKRNNISRVDAIPMASQQFEKDGVHLTKTSRRVFMQGVISGSETFFTDHPNWSEDIAGEDSEED